MTVPSGNVTFTGITAAVPGIASAGGITCNVPSGLTEAFQPGGTLSRTISKTVPSGGVVARDVLSSSTKTTGKSTGCPGFVAASLYVGLYSSCISTKCSVLSGLTASGCSD